MDSLTGLCEEGKQDSIFALDKDICCQNTVQLHSRALIPLHEMLNMLYC